VSILKRERERERGLPQGGLESMQYSRSWSCSMGGWLMSAIGEASEKSFSQTQTCQSKMKKTKKKKKKKKEEKKHKYRYKANNKSSKKQKIKKKNKGNNMQSAKPLCDAPSHVVDKPVF
jgi:leucyl aminopeptidase